MQRHHRNRQRLIVEIGVETAVERAFHLPWEQTLPHPSTAAFATPSSRRG